MPSKTTTYSSYNPMRTYLTALIFGFISTPALLSEGIPVDRKTLQITLPYTDVKLSLSQIEEIESIGRLTLTSAQWMELHSYLPSIPKQIGHILPVTYKGCSCEIGAYAIQTAENVISIIHKDFSMSPAARLGEYIRLYQSSITLRIDRAGRFYYDGAIIPYDELIKVFSGFDGVERSSNKKERESPSSRSVVVLLPFPMKRDSDSIKTLIDKFYSTAKSKGWVTGDDYHEVYEDL